MKKSVLIILAVLMLISLPACKGDGDGDSAEVSMSDYGLGDLAEAAGLERGVIFSELSDEDKAKFEKYAASQGIEVIYGDDGSTKLVYNASAAQKKTVIQSKDGTVQNIEGEGGSAKLNDTWPKNELTDLLPVPDFKVESETEINGKLTVQFGEVSIADMRAYAAEVKAAGFDVDVAESESDGMYSFKAYNADGVKVELSTMGVGSVKITPVNN